MRRNKWLLAASALVVFVSAAMAADPAGFKTLEIGDAAPDFRLPGVDGKDYSLADFAKAKLLAIIFTCNHCPTAQAYEDRIIQMHADYKDKGVALVAISPNDPLAVRLDELGYTEYSDSLEEMKKRAKDRSFQFPYLYDGETQKTSLAYGVLATPQVYLFDQQRKLRYVGRIDDSDVKTVTSHDARNALDALLAGKMVPVEKTRVFGCSTKWSDKRADAVKWLERADAEPVELKPIDETDLARLARNETDKLLVVNVWASWCGPCVAELPDFVTINRMYRKRNFQMITISIDEPEQKADALKLLRENHASATNYISSVTNRDRLADIIDKDWAGPIPHTVLIAPGGKIIYRQTNTIDPIEVRKAIVEFIGRTYANRPAQ
jgi:peroxiredoxin